MTGKSKNPMPELWTLKYAPKNLDEVVGNQESVQQIRKWALDWQRGKKQKPLLLFGPPGTGKTASALAVALEMNWSVLEVNASMQRNAKAVQSLVGSAAGTGTLFGGKRLVLFDEVDGAFDRGQMPALSAALQNAVQPVILTADDVWNQKLTGIRASCTKVEFRKIGKIDVKKALNRIAEKQGIQADVQDIADAAEGDFRSALIDLQGGNASSRMHKKNVFDGVRSVFKATTFGEAASSQDDSDTDFDLFSRWLEENIPVEYEKPQDVAAAFEALSRASVFAGRIRRRQAWTLYKFQRVLTLAGIALAKKDVYRKFTPYRFPGLVRYLGQTRKMRALLKSAAQKMGAKLHCSSKKAREGMSFYRQAGAFFEWDEEESEAAGATPENHKTKRKTTA